MEQKVKNEPKAIITMRLGDEGNTVTIKTKFTLVEWQEFSDEKRGAIIMAAMLEKIQVQVSDSAKVDLSVISPAPEREQ